MAEIRSLKLGQVGALPTMIRYARQGSVGTFESVECQSSCGPFECCIEL